MRVAALPKAPLAPWMTFLSFLLPYASKKAARSSGRSLTRIPAPWRLSITASARFDQELFGPRPIVNRLRGLPGEVERVRDDAVGKLRIAQGQRLVDGGAVDRE